MENNKKKCNDGAVKEKNYEMKVRKLIVLLVSRILTNHNQQLKNEKKFSGQDS